MGTFMTKKSALRDKQYFLNCWQNMQKTSLGYEAIFTALEFVIFILEQNYV